MLKWRLKRVGDDLDRRFQGLDPLLSITGVGILFRMAEQISFHILFDGGRAIRQAGVPHVRSRRMPMTVKRRPRIGDPDDVAEPLGDGF